VLVTGRIEIEAPIVVLLIVSRPGALVMKPNGKSRLKGQLFSWPFSLDTLAVDIWRRIW